MRYLQQKKGCTMKSIVSHVNGTVKLLILGLVLSSCTTYKPFLDSRVDSPTVMKSRILQGEKYEIRLLTGQTMIMKVDSIQDEKLVGNVFVQGSEHNTRIKNYMVSFDQIDSVEKPKISAGKTAIAILLPVTILIIGMSNFSLDMGGMTF
jgi:hypothetical protein